MCFFWNIIGDKRRLTSLTPQCHVTRLGAWYVHRRITGVEQHHILNLGPEIKWSLLRTTNSIECPDMFYKDVGQLTDKMLESSISNSNLSKNESQ